MPSGDLPGAPVHRPSNAEIEALTEELREALAPRIILLQQLGEGGMGRVFLAREPALRRLVAVKVLNPALVGDAVAQARFAREAETAAAVGHPGVVGIYQVGELPKSRSAYFVMQFVEGTSLEQEIKPGEGLPAGKVQRIVGEIAAALAAAHARGLVHRDIKPANIMLDTETGRVVVLDFGISAILDRGTPGPGSGNKLTTEGTAIGTPMYMSPEQALAQKVTSESDIYSLGVVAFELATGKAPFKGDSWGELIAAHVKDIPASVATLRPDLDGPIAGLIDRCLAKEPARRPTAADLARGLLPSAGTLIEWPPPGLAPLRALLFPVFAALGWVAGFLLLLELLLWGQPPIDVIRTGGNGLEGMDLLPLWLFALALCVVFTLLFVPVIGMRIGRLVERWRWGRQGGYPSGILFDVAWDHRGDLGHLVNGTGPFLLLDATTRTQLRRRRRWQAAIIATTLVFLLVLPILWIVGWLGGWERNAEVLLPTGELTILLLPWLLGALAYAWLDRTEQRITGVKRAGFQWKLRRIAPVLPPGLVASWLATAAQDAPTKARGAPLRLIEAFTIVLAIGAGILGASVLWVGYSAEQTREFWRPRTDAFLAAAHADSLHWLPWRTLDSVVALSALPDDPARPPDTLAARALLWSLLSPRDTESVWSTRPAIIQTDTIGARTTYWPHTRVMNALPHRPDRADLELLAVTAATPLTLMWQKVAHGGRLPGLWQFRTGFPGIGRPWEVPIESALNVYYVAGERNINAAVLALAAGDTRTALLHIRENITIGRWCLRSPSQRETYAGLLLIRETVAPLRQIARVTNNPSLYAEADRLSSLNQRAWADMFLVTKGWRGLTADPRTPALLPLLRDSTLAPSLRVYGMAQIIYGYCLSPREMLFGIDRRRDEALTVADSALNNIPRASDFVRLQRADLSAFERGRDYQVMGGSIIERLMLHTGVLTRMLICRYAS